jgi:predicted glycosyltransferase involved in capsule biosynthesis
LKKWDISKFNFVIKNKKFNFLLRLLYLQFLGGATILTEDQIRKANGYSNDFWGWGGEDDDFYTR